MSAPRDRGTERMASASMRGERDKPAGKLSSLGQFVAGSSSGMIVQLLLQPLDVIKTRQQGSFVITAPESGKGILHAPQTATGRGPSVVSTVRSIVGTDGVQGLWRGSVPTTLRVGLGAGIYFVLLNSFLEKEVAGQKDLQKKPSGANAFLSGALARSIAGSLLCPLTVVKVRFEWGMKSVYKSTSQALIGIARTEGLRGLYSGLVATILRDAPFSGLYVMFYSQCKHTLGRLREQKHLTLVPEAAVHFTSGITAGLTATGLTHPFDVIKTRMQLPPTYLHEGKAEAPSSLTHPSLGSGRGTRVAFLEAVKKIIEEEGVRGFFRGVGSRMVKRASATALTWTLYEEAVSRSKLK